MARSLPHLQNAPIREAVIDLRVQSADGFEPAVLDAVQGLLGGDYSKKGPIVQVETRLSVSSEGEQSAQTTSRELGIRLHSRDQKYVAQFSSGGLTVSRLAPYEHWDMLLAEAQKLWRAYVTVATPVSVTRVATRFINDLQLPMKSGEQFELYLTKPPQVPEALPQTLIAFLQKVVMHNADLDCSASITQVLQSGQQITDKIPVILDIDVFRLGQYDPNGQDLWSCLAELRGFKNTIFFESLTDKAVELYA